LVVIGLLGASPAYAQSAAGTDPLRDSYRLLYNGDKKGAVLAFDSLVKAKPELPARFGWLMAERSRLSDGSLRPAFEKTLDAFINDADKRVGKNGKDTEALFYLAQGHFMRAEFRFTYNKGMWGAARDGANAKDYIERYIKLRPDDADAYLVLGMYNYYVDIAPSFVKFLSFLLFLPGGDRVNGLKQVERAAAQGALFAPVAKSMLVEIYSDFEGRGMDAIAQAEQLQRQFPNNDDIAFKLAAIYSGNLVEDRAHAAQVYQGIIERRKNDKTPEGAGSHYNAVLGLATLKREEWKIDEAIAMLTPTIDAKVTTPDWVLPRFLMVRSNFRSVLNDPAAEEDAKRVLADPQMGAQHGNATNVVKQIEQRRTTGEAATIAALIPGNRLTAEGKWDEAQKAYELVRAKDPQNAIVRYRLAYLDFTRGRIDAAMPVFVALAGNKTALAAVRAQSQLHIARIHDLAGRRVEAKKAYQRVIDDFEAQPASVSAAKVGLITAYHRPATARPAGD